MGTAKGGRMRAAVMMEGGAIGLTTVEDPQPGPGELLLRVSACGLCGSDLKARGAMSPGVIMGHEFGGEVVGVGPGTIGWTEGVQAAVLPVASCGSCGACRAGDVAHCSSAALLGLGGGPGGFAELAVVPAASAFTLPDALPPVSAALVEPYAVGLHTIAAVGVESGDSVLVMGAGTVGLTSMTWARLHGAERITVVDPNAARRDAAERCGATDGLVSADEAAPHSFDVAIDCVGKPGLLNACITATRPKGSIVVAGVCTEQDPFWSIAALMKELTIRFAVYYTPDEFRSVIDAFGSGAVEPAGLMGRTMKLDALPEAFEMLRAGSIAGKILIDPS